MVREIKMNNMKRKLMATFVCMLMMMAIGQVCIGQNQERENANLALLMFYPESHDFGNMPEGETANTTFEVWNDGCCMLTWVLTWNCSWVDVVPTQGSCYGNGPHVVHNVSINTTGLEDGLHTCEILINSTSGDGVFTVTVTIGNVLKFHPKSHDFGTMSKDETSITSFEIWRGGKYGTLSYSLTWNCSWVDVVPERGVSDGEHDPINVSINTMGLEHGLHICEILINSNAGDGVFTVMVTIGKAVIEIGDIYGGAFRITAVIKNIGYDNANGVKWSITLDGDIVLLGKKTDGGVMSIPTGENVTVFSNPIFGFGNAAVTVSAEMPGVSSDTKERKAFVLLFFIKILDE